LGIDLTERQKAEKRIAESEAKYRSMMESMTDPVYICSPEFTVEYMNPAMIKRTGRDATGECCHTVLHNLDTKCDWCIFEKIKAGESHEINIVSPKDNRNYRITNMPINNPGGSVSKMTILRDITDYITAVAEKEKAQAQLIQSQKLESIGTLAGGIAHDFNNILSSVIGFTELALDDTEKGSPIEDSLKEIYSGGKRARDLVKQILAFARQSDEVIKPIQVDTLVKEAFKLLRASIPTTIRIDQNIKKGLMIMGNPTQVHQILMNVCTNAAQAMEDDGGVLGISIKDAVIDKKDTLENLNPGEYVVIKISDTGRGIDPEIIDKIFDPYFTTKDIGKGTGMGLALVHGIIKSYNGTIKADSKPGQGAVFTIYLPLIRSSRGADLYQPEILPTGNERILLVDDEVPIVKMSSQILQKLGYDVVFRTSSMKALELFRSNPDDFDLVITDMTMPEMTGDKLATELMSIRRDIPVILCTGYSSKISDKIAADIGIKAFAYKPVSKVDLAKTVRKVLDEAKG
jgi:PAS domain S-box-containing protein